MRALEGASAADCAPVWDVLGLSVQAADVRGNEEQIKRVMEIAFVSQS
jgi:hypothetical protein